MTREFCNRLWSAWFELMPWVAAALVVFTVSWAADGLKEAFEGWMKREVVQGWMAATRTAYVVLFVAAVAWL
jgi:hypothetical protein